MTTDEFRCPERTLLVDADDTLWENNIFYLRCTARFKSLLGEHGIAEERTQETLIAWSGAPCKSTAMVPPGTWLR